MTLQPLAVSTLRLIELVHVDEMMRKYNIKKPGVLIRQCSKWRCPPRDSSLQLEKKLYCKTFLQVSKPQSVHFYLCRSRLLSLLFSSCFVCLNSVRLSFPKDERCTGCFFNCSAQISVLKRKTLLNQRGSLVHWKFHGTESMIVCPSFFILVLKIGRNS